jgi:hypothetical protein
MMGYMKSWHAESSVPNEKAHVVGFMYMITHPNGVNSWMNESLHELGWRGSGVSTLSMGLRTGFFVKALPWAWSKNQVFGSAVFQSLIKSNSAVYYIKVGMGKGNHLRKVMTSEKLSVSRPQDIDGQRGPASAKQQSGYLGTCHKSG